MFCLTYTEHCTFFNTLEYHYIARIKHSKLSNSLTIRKYVYLGLYMLLSIGFKMYLLFVCIISFINVKAHPTTSQGSSGQRGASVVSDITARRHPGISLSAWSRRLEPPPFPAGLPEKVAELYSTTKQSSVINGTSFSHDLVALQHPTSLSTTAVVSLLVFLFYHFHRYFVL